MRRRGQRSVVVCAAVCALLLLATGCGRTHTIPEGVLEIHNERSSHGTIYAIEIQEIVGPNFLAYDVWVRPGDTVVVDVFPSLYDVTIFWEDGGLETFVEVSVVECCTTTVDARR